MCGVDHQAVTAITVAREGLANVARELWTPKRVGTSQLGWPSPQQLSGHLCQVCANAVEATHSIGPSAKERALVASLAPEGVGKLGYGHFAVDGLIGWSVLVARARQQDSHESDPRPNTRAWEHLGDLAALSEQLGRALN